MFRNILKLKNSTNEILHTLIKNSRGLHTKAEEKSFLSTWAKMTESTRKQIGLLEKEPEFAEVGGHAYKEFGEFKGAIECYKHAIKLDKRYEEKAKNEIAELESSQSDKKCRR